MIKKADIFTNLRKENEDLSSRLSKPAKPKPPVVNFSKIVKDAAVLKSTFSGLSTDKALKTAYELGQSTKKDGPKDKTASQSSYASAASRNSKEGNLTKPVAGDKPKPSNTPKGKGKAVARVDDDTLSGNEDDWQQVKKKKDFPKPVIGSKKNELVFQVKDTTDMLALKSKSERLLLSDINAGVTKSHTAVADHDNEAIAVSWTFRDKFKVIFKEQINDKEGIVKALRAEFQMNEDFELLDRPTTSSVKFLAVPTKKMGGLPCLPEDITEALKKNPAWQDVVFHGNPVFIKANSYEDIGPVAVVKVSFIDDKNASAAKRLENTTVYINGKFCRCRKWWNKDSTPQCTNCCRWGHTTFNCRSSVSICAKCAGRHPTTQHAMYCPTCISTGEDCATELCVNCNKRHSASSVECEYYTKRNDAASISEMYRKRADERRKSTKITETAGRARTSN